ncbi:MAG: hypothetical protein JWO26_944, partial [Rhodospirillales bacterium]|nr:hypothetical protein [Rhodospirillales bacterium]
WRRGQAYGQDLRDRVLAAEGETVRQIAERGLDGGLDRGAVARMIGDASAHPWHRRRHRVR